MANTRPTLYTGSTNNLLRRVYEHKNHLIKGFTAKYNLHNLVYYEILENVDQALIREKQIKDLNRKDKLAMIKRFNPQMRDLYDDIIKGDYVSPKLDNSGRAPSGRLPETNISFWGGARATTPESTDGYTGMDDSGQARNSINFERNSMKKWEIVNKEKIENSGFKPEKLINLLLENRGIKTKKDRASFLHPRLEEVTIENVGIDTRQLKKALKRIKNALDNKEQIVIYGDYDVDGITGTAILWETLYALKANVVPYIPNRIEEGYGLSKAGIANFQSQISNVTVIITVDNGIVANDAVDFANEQGIDVIITDHHTRGEKSPEAHAIVHTTSLCGAGVAYLLSREIKNMFLGSEENERLRNQIDSFAHSSLSSVHKNNTTVNREPTTENSIDSWTNARTMSGQARNIHNDSHLELAALGTVADLVPLTGANRAIVKFGLEKLSQTQRPGLQELFHLAGIYVSGDPSAGGTDSGRTPTSLARNTLGVYEVGHIIAPRLNAAGRLESAMDSLRLICTTSRKRAQELASKLELINRERQALMREATSHAIDGIKKQESRIKNVLFVGHQTYKEGVIGLVAGKLVEEFYRPSIVLSIGEVHSKGSARSISGFNIIEFLRSHQEHFVGLGGHPMAAGFTIETAKMATLQKLLEEAAEKMLEENVLQRTLRIDCELPLSLVTQNLYETLQQLSPFGIGNPEPVFVSRNVTIKDLKILGRDGKHLKLVVMSHVSGKRPEGARPESTDDSGQARNIYTIDAIAFNMADKATTLHIGDTIDIAYTIDENRWNGTVKLQLKVKDINTIP